MPDREGAKTAHLVVDAGGRVKKEAIVSWRYLADFLEGCVSSLKSERGYIFPAPG
jgi:hypothetical protein